MCLFWNLSANFRCEIICVRRACYVVYKDTNVYNDMGMTGMTKKVIYENIFSVPIIQNISKSYRERFLGESWNAVSWEGV